MEKNTEPNKRENGIYYTPDALAEYLAQPLVEGNRLKIFDPAYGQGSLLLASELVSSKSKTPQEISLYGCDIHPVNGLLKHLPQANLVQQDFFEYDRNKKFDVVLTNPPYVRHQSQIKEKIRLYRDTNPELSFLSNSSDLWAYFIVKSVHHLNFNGSLGAILPWSFIQANYAVELRVWLATKFSEIKLLALNNPYFESAEERVVLLWLKGYGKNNKSIQSAFCKDYSDEIKYKNLTTRDWEASKVVSIATDELNGVFSTLKNIYQFNTLGTYATSRIGIVTGANEFFVRQNQYCEANGFTQNELIPVLTSAKEIKDLLKNGTNKLKRLILLNESNRESFKWFLDLGETKNFHLRSHSQARTPWFNINKGITPHAFFPYRVGKVPYLVLNDYGIQSTNSIHRIYFNNLNKQEQQWIFVSLLSIYSQLSINVHAKTYGRGMLKIEPGSLAKVLVLKRKENSVTPIYNYLLKLLSLGQKDKAVDVATEFINNKLGIMQGTKDVSKRVFKQIEESIDRKKG